MTRRSVAQRTKCQSYSLTNLSKKQSKCQAPPPLHQLWEYQVACGVMQLGRKGLKLVKMHPCFLWSTQKKLLPTVFLFASRQKEKSQTR